MNKLQERTNFYINEVKVKDASCFLFVEMCSNLRKEITCVMLPLTKMVAAGG